MTDWSIPYVGGFARFNGVDNRPIYPDGYREGTKAFILSNTSRGYGWSANITLNAQPTEQLSVMAAYTRTVAKDVTGMPGSNAESAFTYVPTVEGPNHIKLHNSQYNTPDRLVASLTAHDKGGNHYSLIYEAWRGGANYSFMTVNDINNDGIITTLSTCLPMMRWPPGSSVSCRKTMKPVSWTTYTLMIT